MSKVSEFIAKYPTVQGYTLIRVCEEINRITKAGIGIDGILDKALRRDETGKYLVHVCESFQNQSSN